jgi:hypothetical protein
VSRGIRDEESAARRGEIAIGDVNGDALLALGLEPVEEQRIIELFAGASKLSRPLLKHFDLIDRNRARLGDEPADQRRLAVVDRPAGDEPQQIARRKNLQRLGRIGGGDRVHQK